MTFRAKPVVKRSQRPAWAGVDRRHLLMNVGFGLVVVTAIVLLLVATGLSWYDDHLSGVATVNGTSISKDAYRDRVAIENWRMDEATRRVRNETQAGHLTQAQSQAQQDSITQQRNSLGQIALERVIDTTLQATLATEEGITVTPADIDARMVVEATIPELRHAWVIEIAPTTDPGAVEPTEAQKAAARTRADGVLTDLQAGKAWEDEARTISTDASTASQGGDLGWIAKDDTRSEEGFIDALFAAAAGTPTAVLEGSDGIYRIGRVTEIAPQTVDANYTAKLQADGIDVAKYRAVVAGDVIHQKLEDKIVADASQPGPQRHVSEIYIAAPQTTDLPADSIKVRHILYSPNDDSDAASTLPDTDPAWAKAEADARAAYARIKANPGLFDSIARSESDETSARGPDGTGGKLPYFDSTSQVDPAFLAAITKPGLVPGQLLEPVKSSFGWHVIQVMYRPSDEARLTSIKQLADAGADFPTLARDNSEATSAGTGGDQGWIAKGQLPEALTTAIFAAPVGKTTDVVSLPGDGEYLFKVLAEETRTPVGRQLETIKSTAFATWYAAKKGAATITRDPTIAAGG